MSSTWENHCYGKCKNCRMWEENEDGPVCAALDGREPFYRAECIVDHIQYNEIRLYGINKPPKRR